MHKLVAFDIETNGLNPHEKGFEILGIGVYSEKGKRFFYRPDKNAFNSIIKGIADRGIITHNGIFDANCIYHYYDYDISKMIMHDTMIMSHIIDENQELSLDKLTLKYLSQGKVKINKKHHELTEEELSDYCLKDVELTFKLYEKLVHLMQDTTLYLKEAMPLYREVTIPMKYKGLCVNTNYLSKLVDELSVNCKKIMTEINLTIREETAEIVTELLNSAFPITKNSAFGKKAIELFGTHELPDSLQFTIKYMLWLEKNPELPFVFNIKSNDQLAWLLFCKLGENPVKFSEKTKKPVVNAEILENFRHINAICLLLRLRKEEKILNTYAKPILEKSHNGWIYPDMIQTGTTSGRFSSRNPNFQNLPAGDLRIKEAIVPPKGYVIVSADFSALEPRCFAEVSECSNLIDVYKKGEDLYSRLAIDVFGLKDVSAKEEDENYLKKVNPEYRQKMKVLALAVVYGAGAGRLSKILNIDKSYAQDIIDQYLKTYPELIEYMSKQEQEALATYKVSSKFGRVRHMDKIKELENSDNMDDYWTLRKYLNLAKNHPIQALAAHICNHAAIKTTRKLKEANIDGQIVLQVHDSLVLYVKKAQANRAAEIVKECMEHNEITDQMQVPIIAEPKIIKKLSEEK